MAHRDDFEFFDPRRLRPSGEEITGAAPVPDLSPSQVTTLRPNHPYKPAPDVELRKREVKSSDLVYHALARDSTPMPEAWLSFLGGLVMLVGVWLTWTYASVNDVRVAVSALEIGGRGEIFLACAVLTVLFGLAGAVMRRGRLALFGWLTGLAPAVIAADWAPDLYQGDVSVRVGTLVRATEGVGLGLPVFALGVAMTLLAALWASSPRVGR